MWLNIHLFLLLEQKIQLFGKSAWICGAFLLVVCWGWFFNYFTISHATFCTAMFQVSSWRLLKLNLVTFQAFFKLCPLTHIFAECSMNNEIGSVCIILHLCSLTSCIAHKYKTLETAWTVSTVRMYISWRNLFPWGWWHKGYKCGFGYPHM